MHKSLRMVLPKQDQKYDILDKDGDGFSVSSEWEIVVNTKKSHIDENKCFSVCGEKSNTFARLSPCHFDDLRDLVGEGACYDTHS